MHFNQHFDIPAGLTYLNTPGNGLLPRTRYQWRQQREIDFFEPAGKLRDEQPTFIQGVKETIAQTFHSKAQQVYCTANFSVGYNVLLSGLTKNLTFLLIESDYPSLNYPVISNGFKHYFIPQDENLEAQILAGIVKYNPAVLVLSLVNYITGLKIDLSFIQQLKKQYPDLLIIGDATQFLGTAPFDFSSSGFDAIGASGYKWLMAGFGNGFILLSEQLQEQLYVEAKQRARPSEAMWQHKSILDIYFEPGHQDCTAHGTLQQSLLFLQKLELPKVEKHIANLTQHAYEALADRKLLLPIAATRTIQSPLINIQVDPRLYPSLLAEGIRCFPRGSGIRIGIHLYNTHEDINNLIRIIDKHAK